MIIHLFTKIWFKQVKYNQLLYFNFSIFYEYK